MLNNNNTIKGYYVYASRHLKNLYLKDELDVEYKSYLENLKIENENVAIVDTATANYSAQKLISSYLNSK